MYNKERIQPKDIVTKNGDRWLINNNQLVNISINLKNHKFNRLQIQSTIAIPVICYYNDVQNFIYYVIILPVVLYGCETWSLTLREERRLRVFENRFLRRIFGPKRDENGEWRRLHNEEKTVAMT